MGAKLSSTNKHADLKQDQVPFVTSDQSEIRAVIDEGSVQALTQTTFEDPLLSSTDKHADSKQDQASSAEVQFVTSDQSEIRAVIGEGSVQALTQTPFEDPLLSSTDKHADSKQDQASSAEVRSLRPDQWISMISVEMLDALKAVIGEDDEVLRIVLVGKTGAGKSTTGNTILGYEAFVSEFSLESVTSSCEEARGVVLVREVSVVDTPGLSDILKDDCKEASDVAVARRVSVVDTPGLFATSCSEDKTFEKIRDCISLAAPGPHAFLIVIKLDRFTVEEQRAVQMIQKLFGPKAIEYTMVLFTNGDVLDGKSVEDHLKKSSKLKSLVRKCKDYHVFNNKNKEDRSQVNELLEKIIKMVSDNGGSHYTIEMLHKATRKMKRDRQRQRQRRVEVLGKNTSTAISAGSVLGGAIGGAIGTAGIGVAMAASIGSGVGVTVGLTIGIVYYLYQRNENGNPSGEYECLIDSD